MSLLLLFCICSANFVQSLEDSGIITISAEGLTCISLLGNVSLPCDHSKLIPLKVKILVEKDRNQSWVELELNSVFVELNTTGPFLSLLRNSSQKYSCATYGSTQPERQERDEPDNVTFDPGKHEFIFCNATGEWMSLTWSQQDRPIAMVTRGDTRINIRVERKGPSSISITSIVSPDPDNYPPDGIKKTALLSCKVATGFQKFMEDKYWIIAVAALGYVLFCVTVTCGYMAIRRRRRAEKQRNARFFKVSTARNLYMESTNQEPANWKKDEMYQNFSPAKDNICDRISNKSSFLDVSEGGDSYLEPMSPEEADQISDDGDCYENANEEKKEGSIGSTESQSYEDMNGPKNGPPLTPEKTCEEDADSYENMQAPVYSQLNRSVNSLSHAIEDGVQQTGPDMADISPQQQWPTNIELKQQNGDFYLSYQVTNI
ncbi:B-lymphocyte antigen CD19 [Mantella aurantiaca]